MSDFDETIDDYPDYDDALEDEPGICPRCGGTGWDDWVMDTCGLCDGTGEDYS